MRTSKQDSQKYYIHLLQASEYGYLTRTTQNVEFGKFRYEIKSNWESSVVQSQFTEDEIKAINPAFWNKEILEKVEDKHLW